MIAAAMTDDELIERFEQATLDEFHHADHVRVAFAYLLRNPPLQALERFSEGLTKFSAARGKDRLYHETITWAYVLLIHERMARAGVAQMWEEFAQENPDLLKWKDGLLQRYYTDGCLSSEIARASFVMPDKIY
jgi:hypothetical protein